MIISGQQTSIPEQTLLQMLQTTVTAHADRRVAWFAGHDMSYRQLWVAVEAMMSQLQAEGVQQGDRVGIMLPNCPQYLISYYAITGIGGVVVQINPISPAPELEYLLTDSGCTQLVVYEALLPVVQQIRTRTAVNKLCVVKFGPATNELSNDDVWFDEWVASASAPARPVALNPVETVAVLQYTGGTTGRSKGAMLTHQNLVANAYQTKDIHRGSAEDIVVCALPLFHVYAMTVCMNYAILNGISLLLVPRFQPDEILKLIETLKPTLFPGVPTMYVALSQLVPEGSDALKSLRICNSGGAPMPVRVQTEFERLTGAFVLEGYGLSEASPVTHSNLFEHRKIGSIGLPLANTETRIVDVDDSSKELGIGEVGELAIRGPQVMKGYWNRPDETQQVLVNGWLLTGDIARIDEEGYTYIVDRKKDMIIASGYNVYPRDVEEVLYKHPAVLEAAVIGIPDDYRGETVKAFIVLKPGQVATAEELDTFCRQHLSAYKVPRSFEFRQELPKTPVGKILRRALRQTADSHTA